MRTESVSSRTGTENLQTAVEREKRTSLKIKERTVRELWDEFKRSNIRTIRIPEGQEATLMKKHQSKASLLQGS